MPLSDAERLLVDKLKAIPPNTVYSETGKKQIMRGFKLYAGSRIDGVAWEDGDMVVIVEDGRAMPVRMSLQGENLEFRCWCRTFASDGRCEHVTAALLTAIHLLRPNLFRMTVENPDYHERLRRELMKEVDGGESSLFPGNASPLPGPEGAEGEIGKVRRARKPPHYEITIEENRGSLKAYVECDGERIESSARIRSLPQELAYLAGFSRRDDMSVPLNIFLKKWGKDYPIVFRESGAARAVAWREDIACTTWTELDVGDGEVLVSKRCTMEGDPFPATLLGGFAVNTERTIMCPVKDRLGWELWKILRDASLRQSHVTAGVKETGDWVLRIPNEVFANFQLTFLPWWQLSQKNVLDWW